MKTLRINITRQCNLKCEYCYITNKFESITEKDIINLLSCNESDKVSLSGGEPFLHPELEGIISQIVKRNIKVHIVTNGTLINKNIELLKRLSSYCDLINFTISIDGNNKQKIDSINLLEDYGYKVNIYLYSLNCNLKYLDSLNLFCNKRKITLLFPMPLGNNSDIFINEKLWRLEISKLSNICNDKEVSLYIQSGFKNIQNDYNKEQIIKYSHENSIFIDCNLNTYDCCFIAELKQKGKEVKCCQFEQTHICSVLNVININSELTPNVCPINLIKIQ